MQTIRHDEMLQQALFMGATDVSSAEKGADGCMPLVIPFPRGWLPASLALLA